MSFNQGLVGVPTGSAANSTGLLYHSMFPSSDSQPQVVVAQVVCEAGEVRWGAGMECFTPGQFHINMLVFSLLANILLLAVVVGLHMRLRVSE